MPGSDSIKPSHKAIQRYFDTLQSYGTHDVGHETALRSAFQNLLSDTAKSLGWILVPEQRTKSGGKTVIPDGTLRDAYNLHRGYWEAKDGKDDLNIEIQKKIARGYPLTNIIFEDTRRAVLFQNGQERFRADLTSRDQLAHLLNQYFSFTQPDFERFDQAVDEFKERVPDLAQALVAKIQAAHKSNAKFQAAFEHFFSLCQTALNPNISQAAVDEMLVQHLLTERLIRKIFDNPEFMQRNVIALEVEKVIAALVSKSFNRDDFLKSLDLFYRAIEDAARGLEDFGEKQHFLNTVYERFFQGYSVKVADTHGIVYTPQEIVDFMCASVAEVLETEFGRSLGDKDVQILDPCTGTGNFIVNLLRRVPKKDLPRMYRQQLFANEIMLLPYYIAALNIEHAYYELTGTYEPFEGLCFVDTLDLAEAQQGKFGFMTEANTERVERQKKAPITVVIGNPPYNVGQINENDNNKNRKYPVIDQRIRDTYARDSTATNKNALSDAYVKFFRWASDRLENRDGIVCFVSNNSFVDQVAFDGMRKHLLKDFSHLSHVDLHGNVRKNPKLSGTTHNVFGIQVGVGITIAVRCATRNSNRLRFHRVPDSWRREEKTAFLRSLRTAKQIKWRALQPTKQQTWLAPSHGDEFEAFMPIGTFETKQSAASDVPAIFKAYSRGLETTRDTWVYGFDGTELIGRIRNLIDFYNSEIDRWKRAKRPSDIDSFVVADESKIKWSSRLKETFQRELYASFQDSSIHTALYRPFTSKTVYFDSILNQRVGLWPRFLEPSSSAGENPVVAVTDVGSEKPFMTLIASTLADLHLVGAGSSAQCFAFYVYDENGSHRGENVTDWALEQFRSHYHDRKLTKWDIFYYVYGMLHHSGYREKFADNLKRELPRLPFAKDFRAFSSAGKQLSRLHLDYEQMKPFALKWIESKDVPLSYRVEDKMRLSKDKKSLTVNPSLTLAGIPPEVFEYRLGNRSALEWVIDQYQVTEDKRSGIHSDPNRADDEEYIVRLVGQVIQVSLDTVRIVSALPKEYSS